MAGGDVGGGDGHDAFDGHDESLVALDALDVALGAFEGAAGHAHMLSFLEVDGARIHVFEVGVAAGSDQLEGVHLLVGDDGGVFGAAVPVQDNMAIETALDLFCPYGAAAEENQRADGGLLDHCLFPVMFVHHQFDGVVALHGHPLQLGFHP